MPPLNYNEKKVSQEKAECLYAGNLLKDAKDLNFEEKLEHFQRLNELNDRATTKTLHASVNFDPSENLSNDKLISIACDYINKIGFMDQPFLVYRHHDAGHPHVHIVSTTIREDGTRINTHNIGRNESGQARKEIEMKYGLIQAELQRPILNQWAIPMYPEKIIYRRTETKSSISPVVNAVVISYKYSSLAEFRYQAFCRGDILKGLRNKCSDF